MGWNERSDPDMRTANFCDVYREGVYIWENKPAASWEICAGALSCYNNALLTFAIKSKLDVFFMTEPCIKSSDPSLLSELSYTFSAPPLLVTL